jgi:hypothetical protein
MIADDNALEQALKEIEGLLRKYRHYGHADYVEEILASLETPQPDHDRLRGLGMWGGAGAVWEVNLPYPQQESELTKADQLAFLKAIIRLAEMMNQMGIGTERSREIAATFRYWIAKGLF